MLMARSKIVALPVGLLAITACRPDYNLNGDRPDVDPGLVTECPFEPIPGTKMSKYTCNPVFEGTSETWGSDVGSVAFHATDVLGHPFYQMWYTSYSGTGFGMGYAVSASGTAWDTHPQNPLFTDQPGAWDQDSVAGQVVVWDPAQSRYVMAYQGFTLGDGFIDPGIWGLGIATSPDGVTWTKHPNNPVIDFTNDFDPLFSPMTPCWPLTITVSNGGFRGYIAASPSDLAWQGITRCDIYPMTAVDPGVWQIGNSPVLTGGSGTDTAGVASTAVAELDGVQYMFYVGFTEWVQGQGYISASRLTLNLATSTDGGNTWQKDPSNPLPVNLTQPGEISSVGAQVIGRRIHLWVTDNYSGSSAIGYFYYEPDIQPH